MYYRGIGPEVDKVVEEGKAYTYALERCLEGTVEEREEFKQMLVEWYYSGNWIKEEMAQVTNPAGRTGSLADALAGADVFIGVSAPGVVTT
mgnify:CR=1 FL=1